MRDNDLVDRVGLDKVVAICRSLDCTLMSTCVEQRNGDIELCQDCYDEIKQLPRRQCAVKLEMNIGRHNECTKPNHLVDEFGCIKQTTACAVKLEMNLPGLNEILAAKGNTFQQAGSKRRSAYTSMKKKYTSMVAKELVAQGCVPDEPYDLISPRCTWFEPHRRRDLDNISAGAKFVFDAMVHVGIIKSDNLMHIQSKGDRYAHTDANDRYVVVDWIIIE